MLGWGGNESTRAVDSAEKLPLIVRVILRILFREGPVVLAFLAMLAVILGFVPSPYLGKPFEALVRAHDAQLVVLQEIRDDLKKWRDIEQGGNNDKQRR